MSVTAGLGAFNKDKVASKFGIQLKPKDATQKSSTTTTTTTSTSSTVVKNKTIGDFRTDNSTNGFLSNSLRPTTSKTPEPTRKVIEKPALSKPTSLTSNDNHSKLKSPTMTKRSSLIPTNKTPPSPSLKQGSIQKSEAHIEHQKDQPLYRRQSSKPLENSAAAAIITASSFTSLPTTTAATSTSTNSLKR